MWGVEKLKCAKVLSSLFSEFYPETQITVPLNARSVLLLRGLFKMGFNL
jgi:hypothetical protein